MPPKEAQDHLAHGSIARRLREIALPSATALTFQTLFNLTNSYWAGLWSTDALAALAVSFPIFFLVVIAFSFGFAQGTAALLAHALGAHDVDGGARLWAQALWLALLVGSALAIATVTTAPSIATLLGASGPLLALTLDYTVPLLLATPIFLLGAAIQAALTACGNTRALRDAVIVATILNGGLVPVLMFGLGPLPRLEVAGIAVAHVILQIAQIIWLARCAARTPLARRLMLAMLRPDLRLAQRILFQVVPNALTLASTGVGLALFTGFAGRFGEVAVAAYGVALRIEQLVLLPTLGLVPAIVALVGQNLGAGRIDRVRASALTALAMGIAVMSSGAVIVFVLREPLFQLFTADAEVVSLGAVYLGFAVLAFPAHAVVVLATAVLQGLRKPLPALAVGIGRHLVGPALVLSGLEGGLNLGFLSLALAVPLIAWLAALASSLLIWSYLPRRKAHAAAR